MKRINLKFVSKIVIVITFLVGSFFINTIILNAAEPILYSKDFATWNKDDINGYYAGFLLSNATFNETSSIIIKLYSNNTLLQTNTAITGKIVGTEFLTPFDIFGTFDYKKDGNFTNKRESEYGKTLKPTKVVAIITMKDGQILTVTNENLNIKSSGQVLGQNHFNFTQKMKVGSEGNEVMELQKFLNMNGFNCGIADGKFGLKTKNALALFQTSKGLDADGIVGPQTRLILNK